MLGEMVLVYIELTTLLSRTAIAQAFVHHHSFIVCCVLNLLVASTALPCYSVHFALLIASNKHPSSRDKSSDASGTKESTLCL